MFITKYYLLVSVIFAFLGAMAQYWWLTAIAWWISLSFFAVSLAYLFDLPWIFRKSSDGSIPVYTRWLFWPFLLCAQIYNYYERTNDSVPAIQQITDHLFLASRLFKDDLYELRDKEVVGVLDATAEFSGLLTSADEMNMHYLNVPVLDHKTPKPEDLRRAVNWLHHLIKQDKKVVVHCALGRGRSVMIVAAYLLATEQADSIDDAMSQINSIRGTARLNSFQKKQLQEAFDSPDFQLKRTALLIANPVSGGGKWIYNKDEIVSQLASKFDITILETKEDMELENACKQHDLKNIDVIIGCGGDGTINDVANIAYHHNKPLGIIPLGTTNALSHVLFGMRSKFDPVNVATTIAQDSQIKKMDVIKCNERICVMSIGIGIEQEMLQLADREFKNESGELAYIQSFIQALQNNKSRLFQLTINGETQQEDVTSLVIANAAPFSSILALGKGSPSPFDNQMDVTLVRQSDNPYSDVASLATQVFNSSSENTEEPAKTKKTVLAEENNEPHIVHWYTDRIQIKSETVFDYSIDGELEQASTLDIENIINGLSVFVKKEATLSENKN